MRKQIQQKISLAYQKRRQHNEEKAIKQIEETYRKYPDLQELDRLIGVENLRIAEKILSDGKERISSERKDELILQRNDYLSKNRIPVSFDHPVYTCTLCNDTGIIQADHAMRCVCYYEILKPLLTEVSNLGGLAGNRFEDFSFSLFSDQISLDRYGSELSPRKQMEGVHAIAWKFANEPQRHETGNLFFLGNPGTGKTYLSACIANEWIRHGKSVLYVSAPELFDRLSARRIIENAYAPDPERREQCIERYEDVMQSDLLIVDDFGTEAESANRQPDLLSVLNMRVDTQRKMIISTNLDIDSIYEFYDERILSRIYGHFTILKFFGDDLRHINRIRKSSPK